jgi:ABC-type bacteriocin/lantibiotic exporter with double-glycine peptidase domain
MFLIKLLKTVSSEVSNFKASLKKYYKAHLDSQKVGTLTTTFPQFATLLLLSILLAFFNFAKVLTLDFIGVLVRLFQGVSSINKNIMLVSNNHVVINKLYTITENSEKIYSHNFIVNNKLNSAISIKDLSFGYYNSKTNIFDNINLEIKKNTHNVITGPNGSGKSTLLGLCSGLLYPQKGSTTTFSSKFGYVGVTPLIITGTLKENLLYGNPKVVSDQELYEYIENFGLFNEENNMDLNKKISIKTLSSGQLQKISFIRSLLGDVEILLLDESTSNLDISSKNLIFDILADSKLTILNSTHNSKDFKTIDNYLNIEIENDKRIINSRN